MLRGADQAVPVGFDVLGRTADLGDDLRGQLGGDHLDRPELVVQRANRGMRQGQVKDESDQIVLLGLDAKGTRFAALNQLTVHEY